MESSELCEENNQLLSALQELEQMNTTLEKLKSKIRNMRVTAAEKLLELSLMYEPSLREALAGAYAQLATTSAVLNKEPLFDTSELNEAKLAIASLREECYNLRPEQASSSAQIGSAGSSGESVHLEVVTNFPTTVLGSASSNNVCTQLLSESHLLGERDLLDGKEVNLGSGVSTINSDNTFGSNNHPTSSKQQHSCVVGEMVCQNLQSTSTNTCDNNEKVVCVQENMDVDEHETECVRLHERERDLESCDASENQLNFTLQICPNQDLSEDSSECNATSRTNDVEDTVSYSLKPEVTHAMPHVVKCAESDVACNEHAEHETDYTLQAMRKRSGYQTLECQQEMPLDEETSAKKDLRLSVVSPYSATNCCKQVEVSIGTDNLSKTVSCRDNGGVTAVSVDATCLIKSQEMVDVCSAVTGELRSTADATPDSSGGQPAGCYTAVIPSDAAVIPSNAAVMPSDAAVMLGDDAFMPSDGALMPSDGASVMPKDAVVMLIDAAVLPSAAGFMPSDAVVMSNDAVVVPNDAVVVQDDAIVVQNDAAVMSNDAAVVPSDAAVVPSDAVVMPSDAAVVPSDAVVMPSDAAVMSNDAVVMPSDAVHLTNFSSNE